MCYDISLLVPLKKILRDFPSALYEEEITTNPEAVHILGHSYGEHPILYKPQDNDQIVIKLMEWGIIPFYVKDEAKFKKQRAMMLNARSEKILNDTKSYWHKIRNRRCLVPVTGFYEHRSVKGFKHKIPYYITMKNDEIFYLPGLYSVAQLPDTDTGEMIERYTFTIVTRGANSIMELIHNGGPNNSRMPLMLPLEKANAWLESATAETEIKEILDFEMDSGELNWTPVYTIRGGKERPDQKAKNSPYDWEGLETLKI